MSLPSLLGFRAGQGTLDLVDERLTDMDQVWKEQHLINRAELRPLWWFAIAVSLGVVMWLAHRGAPLWQCAVLAGPLLFSLQPLTSYDYIWLIALSALATSRRRAIWLVGYTGFTVAVGVVFSDMDRQHLWFSLGALALLVALTVSVAKEYITGRRQPESDLAAT
jgi:hypothetical protein